MAESKSTPAKASSAGNITQRTPYQQWVEGLKNEAELTASFDSGNDIAADIMAKILEAETLDDAFAAQDSGLQNGKDFVDVEITVQDFELRPSDQKYLEKSTLGVYAKVTGARLDNGESFQFFTGAPNVVALLWKARYADSLPLDCVIKAKETANGELLSLRPLPKRVIRG